MSPRGRAVRVQTPTPPPDHVQHEVRMPHDQTPVSQHVLENGLTVVWQEDHRQPLVALEARILGGLRGEGAWLGTGVTHFIEHLLFKGTPSRPPGTIDAEVRRYGGTINAFTSHDYTGVSLVVDSQFLREGLGLLADLLQHATFPEEEFTKERAVVISEIQMNRDDPERRLHELFWNRALLRHPYRHPILGYQPLLERLTVDQLRAFYHAQYVPDNVVLACVGDVGSSAFPRLVDEAFGSWSRGAPYQILAPEEPPAASARQVVEELPVQAAYAVIGVPSTRLTDPDLYPLDVLASVLGQGQSARLHEELVHRQRLAHAIGAANYTPMDPGMFTVSFRTDPERVSAVVEGAWQIIEDIKANGIADQELAKAKRQVIADYVFGHQTIDAKAGELASSLAQTGDPSFALRYVEGIGQVTAEQVQEVARRHLNRNRSTLVVLQPSTGGAKSEAATAPKALEVHKTVLPNGLTVLLGTDHQLPMAVVVVAIRGGVRVETEATQGLSHLVAEMLAKGTSRRSALEIARLVESLGGILEPFSGRDGFGLALQVLAGDVEQGMALVHELMTDSTFPEEELDLERHLMLKELAARDDDMFDRASRLLRRTLFTAHPYRFDPLGAPDTVQRLSRPDCLAFAKTWLVPKNLVITVVGDLQEAKILADIQRRFGTLPAAQAPWPSTLTADALDGIRQASATVPKEQSVIFLGFRGTRVTAQDRDALDVLTTVLSGMSGRLFQAVREQQGLSYTLGAVNIPGWDPGYLTVYAATKPQARQQVLAILQQQLQAVVERGVTEDELEGAKRHLLGGHRLELQNLSGLARRITLDELYGLGYDHWTRYEQRIRAVTLPMVHEVAKRYLTLSKHAEIIVTSDELARPSP